MSFKIIMTTSVVKIVRHKTTSELQDQESQDRLFWSQTGLVIRPDGLRPSLTLTLAYLLKAVDVYWQQFVVTVNCLLH